ncbi:MAG: hypothetical protein AB7O91_05200 [Sphingomonas sp.]
MKRLALVLLSATACTAAEQPDPANAAQTTNAAQSVQARPVPAGFTSAVAVLRVTMATQLPRGPGVALGDYCSSKAIDARSPQGRAVEGQGWHVTAEMSAGRFQAISFAGRFEPMTSGVCGTSDGNIALFDGERLAAIVHAARPGTATPRLVTALGEAGRLRIWGDEYAPPLADILVSEGGAAVVPVADADRWCGGSVSVPNIFAASIQTARTRLLRAEWRADARPAGEIVQGGFGRDSALRREGMNEVESCSGTGYGLCIFNYRSGAGPTLQVITAGDAPTVVDYGVECRPRQQ